MAKYAISAEGAASMRALAKQTLHFKGANKNFVPARDIM